MSDISRWKEIKGVGTALVTPMNADGSVDYQGLERLIKYQIDGGVNFLVVQGTTGESVTLDQAEKQKILDSIVEANNGQLPIVFGIGGNNTKAVCETFEKYNLSGVDAILSASPSYNKPTQEGIVAHFRAVADASPLPIILYNVPGRTASNMSVETTISLAQHENIFAIKEASGDLGQIMEIINQKPDNFKVLSGDDALTLPMCALGAKGVISVVSNVAPEKFSNMVNYSLKGDYELARKLHYELLNLMNQLFEEGNPGGAKEALKILKICDHYMRLPLVNVSASLNEKLEKTLSTL